MKPGSGREGGSAGDEPHGNAGLVGCEVREPAAIGMDMTWCNGRLLVEILNCRDGFFTCTSGLVLAVDDPRRSESPDSASEALILHSEGSPVAGTPRTIF